MHINELSAKVETQLRQLDRELSLLLAREPGVSPADAPALAEQIAQLQQARARLVKSRDLAFRAHQLQQDTDLALQEQQRLYQRRFGLALCVISGLGLVVLVFLLLQSL